MKMIRILGTVIAGATLLIPSVRSEGASSQVSDDVYQPVTTQSSVLNTVTNGTRKLVKGTVKGTKAVLSYPGNLVSRAIKKVKS